MALEAGFRRVFLGQEGPGLGMVHAVAIQTGEIPGLVLAAFPKHPIPLVMTLETKSCGFGRG